jgi:hypothetical protein
MTCNSPDKRTRARDERQRQRECVRERERERETERDREKRGRQRRDPCMHASAHQLRPCTYRHHYTLTTLFMHSLFFQLRNFITKYTS